MSLLGFIGSQGRLGASHSCLGLLGGLIIIEHLLCLVSGFICLFGLFHYSFVYIHKNKKCF